MRYKFCSLNTISNELNASAYISYRSLFCLFVFLFVYLCNNTVIVMTFLKVTLFLALINIYTVLLSSSDFLSDEPILLILAL